jgi:Homeodomain-like domain
MNKKYIVRLTAEERQTLREMIQKLKGSSQKVRRAQMLLKADVSGPAWTDGQIAEAFDSRTRTVEKLRERFVSEGFEQTLHGKQRERPATEKILGGKQEAQVIALRLGPPPKGYANWTLRLLARKVVALEIVESVSYETLRRTLKKTG